MKVSVLIQIHEQYISHFRNPINLSRKKLVPREPISMRRFIPKSEKHRMARKKAK